MIGVFLPYPQHNLKEIFNCMYAFNHELTAQSVMKELSFEIQLASSHPAAD